MRDESSGVTQTGSSTGRSDDLPARNAEPEIGHQAPPIPERALQVLSGEVLALNFRFLLARALVAPLPRLAFSRLRAALYRAAGLHIGEGTLILGTLDLGGPGNAAPRLTIGARCMLNTPLFIDLNDRVSIGDDVNIGNHSTLITSTHLVGWRPRRAGQLKTGPVVLEDGCWLGAGVTVLPGVTVGRGAVIAAGAVVTADIPPDTLAGGIPARVIKSLPDAP